MFLSFLGLLFLKFAEISGQVQVNSTKIYNFQNGKGSSIFYTDLVKNQISEQYNLSQFSISKELGIGMLSDFGFSENCSCPQLRKIHLIKSSGMLKFEYEPEKIGACNSEDFGVAGFLAPFPGYCFSDGIELIEFYSPVLNEFRYDTSNNIWSYYSDFVNFFRPVRVIGYAYYSTSGVWMSGTPPFIKSGVDSILYKASTIRFSMVRQLTKSGKNSYLINNQNIDKLIADGWELSTTVLPGPLSSQNDIGKISEKCGKVEKCVEVYNDNLGVYQIINSDSQNISNFGSVISDCGYFLTNSSANCFENVVQYYSYIPSYNKNSTIYANYNDGSSGNSVGFVNPYIFSLLKF